MHDPDRRLIHPLSRPPHTTVRVPGSKSITNRALPLAALTSAANGACAVEGALHSEDTEVMAESLRRLGFGVETDWPAARVVVRRPGGSAPIPAAGAELFVANSGTTMRFLTALVALGRGRFRLDGVARMRERPIGDLLETLRALGVRAASERDDGCPPVVVQADGLHGGDVTIRGGTSSQFLSGLLLAAPFADAQTRLTVEGPLVSVPYVTMTVAMLRQFGLTVHDNGEGRYRIPGRQRGGVSTYRVEPDASAASYFLAAAAITGGQVTVAGLPVESLQGDVRFAEVLGQMGCRVVRSAEGVTVGGGPLRGIDVDMNDISDTVMTLAAVACFAEGPTTIRNVGHIRHKETDRLAALAAELRKLGAAVEERADGLTLTPGSLHGAELATYDDHRMAMSLALIGLRVPNVVILEPGCVAKTYPHFFDDLERLR